MEWPYGCHQNVKPSEPSVDVTTLEPFGYELNHDFESYHIATRRRLGC